MKLVQTPAVYIDQWVYWLWYILPAVAFIVFVFINRKQAKANANVALMKNRKANKVALKRLKIAGKYLKNHDKEHFYDEVLKAVWGYLSDKLNIPNSELTKDNVAAELAKYGAGEELIAEFNDILGRCEFAQYAPAQSNEAMDELYNHTVEAIGKMENTVKK
ncbi:MAG TPA: BatD family protein, partial [Candidatus Barnesiella excrementigallinarum]|nr:BatD family protein [Candidatus Barnesiella excrementigallinarum]